MLIFVVLILFLVPAVAATEYNCAAGRHRYNVTVREPTATADGERLYVCELCGHRHIRILFATQCNWSEWVIDEHPTCTQPGQQHRVCTTTSNHHRETQTIAALGHDFVLTASVNPTCTTVGTRTYTCRRCGHVRTETLAALGHEHEVTVTDPTCTDEGARTYACARCDDSRTETFGEALGHSYVEEITTQPTYDEDGVKTFTCEHCGDSYTESIPALVRDEYYYYEPHECEFILYSEQPPCCEDEGYSVYICTVCGETRMETIAATGHDFGDWVTDRNPTLFRAGRRHTACGNPAECLVFEIIPRLVTRELNYIDMIMAPVNLGFLIFFMLLLFFDLDVIIWDLRKRLKAKKAKRLKIICALCAAALMLFIVMMPLMLLLLISNMSYMNLLAFTAIVSIVSTGVCLRHYSHRRRIALNGSRGVYQAGKQHGLLVSGNRVKT